jgi:hypothetical protein
VRRREFITLLGGAAAWPLAGRAQQGERMRRVIVLMGIANDAEAQARAGALRQGLQVLGWTVADGDAGKVERRGRQMLARSASHRQEGMMLDCAPVAAEQRMCSRGSIGYKVPEVRIPLGVSVGSL